MRLSRYNDFKSAPSGELLQFIKNNAFGENGENLMKFNDIRDLNADGATTKSSGHEVVRFEIEIDASPDANSLEIEKLRRSAFQNGAFRQTWTSKRPLKVDFESVTKLCIFHENFKNLDIFMDLAGYVCVGWVRFL